MVGTDNVRTGVGNIGFSYDFYGNATKKMQQKSPKSYCNECPGVTFGNFKEKSKTWVKKNKSKDEKKQKIHFIKNPKRH